ncbi:glycosyltransferase family 4 protein [Devosia sp. XJ19-1]|uniref:Glycosyltransferase family 4 protein n=1 Tax=Devosia ureilytica TaxID=2952754 RepID=A0A9Q4AKU9_9HYPH|nr:glycosyltransferase family 4 protein [Devosia ureilytica]MCP8882622.1 glycosyltransferase family 4 protein [Devosia ureilytica]MCP8885491.1 glycosyltransferase family 4 protein [Devosia ureilytica]
MQQPPKSPQRVGIIGNNAFSIINFRLPLMREIAARGHQVFAIAAEFDADSVALLAENGISAIPMSLSRTGLNPFRDARDVFNLVKTLGELRLDTVLAFTIKPVIYGMIAASLARVPRRHALIAGLGYAFGDTERPSLKRRVLHAIARTLYTIALGRAHNVFMQNPDDVEDFARMHIVGPEKMVLVNGTGVDLAAWPQLVPVTVPVTFLLAARLLAEKGIHDYVAAAKTIKASAPHSRFLLLGGLDSNPNGISRTQVEQWVADGLIEWPGHVPVRPWLAQASVYVLPSYYREGIPRSIQEALACGLPVITTNSPGCRETVVQGENGFLVAPRESEQLVQAMQHFIDDPRRIVDMGRQSRLLAEQRFDVRVINARMLEVMEL